MGAYGSHAWGGVAWGSSSLGGEEIAEVSYLAVPFATVTSEDPFAEITDSMLAASVTTDMLVVDMLAGSDPVGELSADDEPIGSIA